MFTAVTVLTLAIGIGANTAIFSVINGVLLKPLPYADPEQLVGVWHTAPGLKLDHLNCSPSTYFTYREENRVFQEIALYRDSMFTVTGHAEPERIDGLEVTFSLFPLLGVRPALGRTFAQADDAPGAPQTAILSYAYWQRKFGAAGDVLGRRIMVDGAAREIIGVMPQDFRFLDLEAALFVPMQLNRAKEFVGHFNQRGIVRLKPGATIAQANADVARMIPLMMNKFPMPPGFSRQMMESVRMGPDLHPLKEDVVGDVGKTLWVLMGTVGIVLLIACANVANLFLVRAEGRQRELAIRAALGAGRGTIARELLAESVGLGLAGGVLGLGLAYAGLRLLVYLEPSGLPRLWAIGIDASVLLFTLLISILAGAFFGLMPVWKFGGYHLSVSLKEGGRAQSEGKQHHRARNVLVVAQIGLSLVLLVSAGLMIRTFQAMRNVNPGFVRPEEVFTFRLSILSTKTFPEEQVARTHEQILERIRQLPGVASAAISSRIAMSGSDSNDPIMVEEKPLPEGQMNPIRRFKYVSPGFFATMGTPILAGRDFTWNDVYGDSRATLVSESFSRLYWKTPAGAIGKRIRESAKSPWREIVGVVADTYDDGVDQKPPTIVYWPMLTKKLWGDEQTINSALGYAVRSKRTGTPAFFGEVRDAVSSVSRELPIYNARTLKTVYDRSMARTSFTLVMLGIAGGMALLLGLVGIYGVISYSVSQRTREIGIRMALGAEERTVQKLFVRQGLVLAVIGIVAGLLGAAALTRAMSTLLYGVNPVDPVTYVAVAVVLAAATLLASWVPARRATSVDPVRALRAE